jgi:N-acetylglucosamine kinase-like BadF-type ATPase
MGEGAGASELVGRALQAVAHAWTRRGPATALTGAFLEHTGTPGPAELLEGLVDGRAHLNAEAAPLVFRVAAAGDPVALDVIRWAGCELAELAKAVIRQLEFEALAFDVVLVGGMYDGGAALIDPMRAAIQALAPGARLVRLAAPPVVGATLLGMETAGLEPAPSVRETLARSVAALRRGAPVREP